MLKKQGTFALKDPLRAFCRGKTRGSISDLSLAFSPLNYNAEGRSSSLGSDRETTSARASSWFPGP